MLTLSVCGLVCSCAEGDTRVDHRGSVLILESLLREPMVARDDVGCAHRPNDTRPGHLPGWDQFDLINHQFELSSAVRLTQQRLQCDSTNHDNDSPSATDAIFSQQKLRRSTKDGLSNRILDSRRHCRCTRAPCRKCTYRMSYAAMKMKCMEAFPKVSADAAARIATATAWQPIRSPHTPSFGKIGLFAISPARRR